jgi:hypothetical protein
MNNAVGRILTVLTGAVLFLAIGAAAYAAPCMTSSPTCFRPDFIRTGAAPDPNPPLTVEVTNTDDVVGVPDVQIEMNVLFGADSPEFTMEVVMNLHPDITPSALTFTQTAGAAVVALQHTTQNAQSLPPEGGFDIFFAWATTNRSDGSLRFNENDVMKFTVSCAGDPDCGGFSATAFNFLTAGGFRIGAKINGIPTGACYEFDVPTGDFTCSSGKVFGKGLTEVPAPATVWLIGAGLLGLGAVGRRFAR